MLGLTIWDFILAPFLILLISFVAKRIKRRYANDIQLQFYFAWGFRIKMAMVIVYTLLSATVIAGDQISLYFGEGKHFAELIHQDINNIYLLFTNGGTAIDEVADEKGYLLMESNYLVVKVSIILCLLTASKFMLINIILGFIAFLGSWKLFLFFRSLYPHLHKILALATMGIPTVVFWSSGINKETICMASLGFLTKCLFDVFANKKDVIRNSIISVIAIYLIATIKAYIIISYLPFFMFFLLLYKINKTTNPAFRTILKLTIPLVFIGAILYAYTNMQEFLAQYASEKVLDSISNTQQAFKSQSNLESGSYFTLGEFDGSIGSFVSMMPLSVITTFFRPFLWECRNLIMLLTSMEGLALLFFTLRLLFYKRGIRMFFSKLFTDPVVMYSISFAVLFAIFVGTSTFNFGSLARYKIPCLPFYLCALAIIQSYTIARLKDPAKQTDSN
jgi:hypothetical protein